MYDFSRCSFWPWHLQMNVKFRCKTTVLLRIISREHRNWKIDIHNLVFANIQYSFIEMFFIHSYVHPVHLAATVLAVRIITLRIYYILMTHRWLMFILPETINLESYVQIIYVTTIVHLLSCSCLCLIMPRSLNVSHWKWHSMVVGMEQKMVYHSLLWYLFIYFCFAFIQYRISKGASVGSVPCCSSSRWQREVKLTS